MHMVKTLLILLLVLFQINSFAGSIEGYWLSEKKSAVIQIYKNKNHYNGKIVWLKRLHTGEKKILLDINNPDEKLKKRNLLGLDMLTNLKKDGDEFSGGSIYDPNSGKTYKSYMKLENKNKLKIRGYVGISLFGRSSYWTREESATPKEFQKKGLK